MCVVCASGVSACPTRGPLRVPLNPPALYPSPRIVLSVLVPWVVWMSLMVMMLLYQGADDEHVDMQPQLSKGVGCAFGSATRPRSVASRAPSAHTAAPSRQLAPASSS